MSQLLQVTPSVLQVPQDLPNHQGLMVPDCQADLEPHYSLLIRLVQHLQLDLMDPVTLAAHLDLAVQCFLMVQHSRGCQENPSLLWDQPILEYLLDQSHQDLL
jgi:hypothetical protein